MRTRRIGQLEVSEVGLGCNNFGGRMDWPATRDVVAACLDAGITFFDTADSYGGTLSEELLGRALGSHRDEVVVATKFGSPIDEARPGGASAAYIRRELEDSLRRLGTDYIDLYQLHFPDPKTPIGETLAELDDQVRKGKVREIGCSNLSVAQLDEAAQAAGTTGADGAGADGAGARFVSVQNEYSILHREPETGVLDACDRLDLAFLPYFPLAHGLLTGKYAPGQPPPPGTRLAGMPEERRAEIHTDERSAQIGALADVAHEARRSLGDLAIGWLLQRPAVASVIAGATKPEQVRQNAAAANFELPADLLARIDEIAPAPPPG